MELADYKRATEHLKAFVAESQEFRFKNKGMGYIEAVFYAVNNHFKDSVIRDYFDYSMGKSYPESILTNLQLSGRGKRISRPRVVPLFAWFDLWIGVFIDRPKGVIYIFPVPMFGIKIYYKW